MGLVLVGGKQKVQSCLFIYEQKEKGIWEVVGCENLQCVLDFILSVSKRE